jgi:hypothetical protein
LGHPVWRALDDEVEHQDSANWDFTHGIGLNSDDETELGFYLDEFTMADVVELDHYRAVSTEDADRSYLMLAHAMLSLDVMGGLITSCDTLRRVLREMSRDVFFPIDTPFAVYTEAVSMVDDALARRPAEMQLASSHGEITEGDDLVAPLSVDGPQAVDTPVAPAPPVTVDETVIDIPSDEVVQGVPVASETAQTASVPMAPQNATEAVGRILRRTGESLGHLSPDIWAGNRDWVTFHVETWQDVSVPNSLLGRTERKKVIVPAKLSDWEIDQRELVEALSEVHSPNISSYLVNAVPDAVADLCGVPSTDMIVRYHQVTTPVLSVADDRAGKHRSVKLETQGMVSEYTCWQQKIHVKAEDSFSYFKRKMPFGGANPRGKPTITVLDAPFVLDQGSANIAKGRNALENRTRKTPGIMDQIERSIQLDTATGAGRNETSPGMATYKYCHAVMDFEHNKSGEAVPTRSFAASDWWAQRLATFVCRMLLYALICTCVCIARAPFVIGPMILRASTIVGARLTAGANHVWLLTNTTYEALQISVLLFYTGLVAPVLHTVRANIPGLNSMPRRSLIVLSLALTLMFQILNSGYNAQIIQALASRN